ncbi:MAG: DUF4271 domain-containing protein [Alistipes sp.]|nr:DUF4271 domain-containing protein [Alistipes sp.]
MTSEQTAADTLTALPTQTPLPADTLAVEPALPAADTTGGTLLRNDTLALPAAADSLLYGDSLFMAGFPPADSLTVVPEPLYRPASAREVFGPLSLTVAPSPKIRTEPARPLTGNPYFETLVLALAAAYALLLYRHINDVRLLFYRVTHDRTSGERLMEESGGNNLVRFLKIASIIGLLFVGIAAVKYTETLLLVEMLPELPAEITGSLSLLFAGGWMAIVLFQWLLLTAAGAVTLSRHFMIQLRLLKRTYFALAVIVAAPPVLLFALCPPGTGRTWFYIAVAELAITAILCVRETLHLFISKKVPILHWFLYLCTVEIFPFSLLWLLAIR